ESSQELYPPVYPPQVGLLFAPFTNLPYRAALLLWIMIPITLYAGIVWNAWKPVAKWLPDRRFVFVAAAGFPPFWNLILHGQLTIVVLMAFWLAWIALERRRPFLAGCALGILAIKPQFGLVLAVVMLAHREWAIILGAIASTAFQIATVIALLGS